MGIFTNGQPLCWQETKKYADLVRLKGVKQFIKLYNTFKQRDQDCFKYGDEIEYSLVRFDHEKRRVQLLLKANELLKKLDSHTHRQPQSQWAPEFANFMIEGMPFEPYEHAIGDICRIEENMQLRRQLAQSLLDPHEHVMTFSTFPLLGCPDFTTTSTTASTKSSNSSNNSSNIITNSMFFPDEAIFQGNPRYATSLINNRERRKSKSQIHIPIFVDKRTPRPFVDDLAEYDNDDDNDDNENDADDDNNDKRRSLREDHIYLDGIGAPCACLQATFQARNLSEARHLYDQLAPFTPILLALSAASPIWRGYLSDVDCRWKAISESLDDRTEEERGEMPLLNDKYRIFKSRYDSIDCYLSERGAKYNDIPVVIDADFYTELVNNNVDALMAQHVAHLFIRDPLILFKENVFGQEEEEETTHFENIQSTNWQSLRFKPPPKCDVTSSIGWRVEFRTTELQITDFENAAFVSFLVLLTRMLLSFDVDFLMPISLVDENMRRAQKRNACQSELFHFRVPTEADDGTKTQEMSVNEIINGSAKFVGVIPLICRYLNEIHVDCRTHCRISQYLKFIGDRASGKLKTTATWMRDFVLKHPKYKLDSKVSNEIAYDLVWTMNELANEKIQIPELVDISDETINHQSFLNQII